MKTPRGGVPEAYLYNGQSWDVTEARRFVADRWSDVLLINDALAALVREQDDLDPWWAVTNADMAVPVLVIPLPEALLGRDAGDLVRLAAGCVGKGPPG